MIIINGNVTDKAYNKLNSNNEVEYLDLSQVRIKSATEKLTFENFGAYRINKKLWVVSYTKDNEKTIDTRIDFTGVMNLYDKLNN